MSEVEIALFAAEPAADDLVYETGQAILAIRPLIDALSADPFGRTPANVGELLAGIAPSPGALAQFAAQRRAANPLGDAVYLDRPLIVALDSIYARDPASGDFLARQALDIVAPGIGVSPFAPYDPFLVRLSQGLADAQAEAAAPPAMPGCPSCRARMTGR